VAHDTRWDLPLPDRKGTLAYMQAVLERSLAGVGDVHRPEIAYYYRLALLHEDMHDEAFTYTRQTLGYPAPALVAPGWGQAPAEPATGAGMTFAAIAGGVFEMGSGRDERFVFDNEKWEHRVEVAPFEMARTAVTYGELARFVDEGGYTRRELWSPDG